MPLETATYIDSLVESNPDGGVDDANTADDHLRLIKAAIKRTFPNINGRVATNDEALNRISSITSNAQDQLDTLKDGKLDASATAVYAQSAGYATSASNASYALSTGYAASAGHAGTAVYANSAGHALTADDATNATNATNAQSAAYANSAAYAADAGNYDGDVSAGQLPSASLGGAGILEFGTTAQYQTATDTARGISLGVIARPRNKGTEGYVHLGAGIVLQWGTVSFSTATTAMTDVAETFPREFDTVYQVVVGAGAFDGVAFGYQCEVYVDTSSITTTGFDARFKKAQTQGTFSCRWFAIGTI